MLYAGKSEGTYNQTTKGLDAAGVDLVGVGAGGAGQDGIRCYELANRFFGLCVMKFIRLTQSARVVVRRDARVEASQGDLRRGEDGGGMAHDSLRERDRLE